MSKLKFNIDLKVTDNKNYQKRIVEFIKSIVADYYGRDYSDYQRNSRKREIAMLKHVAMYFIKKKVSGLSLAAIGTEFGDMDHATVLYAIRKIENLLDWDKSLSKELKEIDDIIEKKGLSQSRKINLEKEYYFIDMNAFISMRQSGERAIVLVGYSEEEAEALKSKGLIPSGSEKRVHKMTGIYILEKRQEHDTNTNIHQGI